MGCYMIKNDDGNRQYSNQNQDKIKNSILNGEDIRDHYKSGFRFHHLIKIENSSGNSTISFLKFVLENGKREILKNGVFTADINCLKENINGKIIFKVILSDNDLFHNLVQTYYHSEYRLFLDEYLKKEYAFAYREKSENSKLWKDSKIVFNFFGDEIQEILDEEEYVRG